MRFGRFSPNAKLVTGDCSGASQLKFDAKVPNGCTFTQSPNFATIVAL